MTSSLDYQRGNHPSHELPPIGTDSLVDPNHGSRQALAFMQQDRSLTRGKAEEPLFLDITPISSVTEARVGRAPGVVPVAGDGAPRAEAARPNDGTAGSRRTGDAGQAGTAPVDDAHRAGAAHDKSATHHTDTTHHPDFAHQPDAAQEKSAHRTHRRQPETRSPVQPSELEPHKRPPDATPVPTVADAHARVAGDAARYFADNPQALAQFNQDMQKFEQRMRNTPGGQEQIARTYEQIGRLMEGQSPLVGDQARLQIAADVMHGAARGVGSNQGLSLDCAASFLTDRLYTKNPAEAARAVADATLTGTYTDASGRKITLDHDTIAVHRTEQTDEGTKLGAETRTHGDQILQAIIRNEQLYDLNGTNSEGPLYRYEIGKPSLFEPTGEHVYDYSQHPRQDVSYDHMAMPADRTTLESVYQHMTGTSDQVQPHFIMGGMQGNGPAQLSDFRRQLADAARRGDFPLSLEINPNQEPFKTQMGVTEQTDILHAITVTGYNPETGEIQYRNPAFGSRQFSLNDEQMFNAMHAHVPPQEIERTAEELKKHAAELQSNPERMDQMRRTLFDTLYNVEPDQRKQILFELSRRSGVNLVNILTPEQRRELGVEPNLFDHLFGRVP